LRLHALQAGAAARRGGGRLGRRLLRLLLRLRLLRKCRRQLGVVIRGDARLVQDRGRYENWRVGANCQRDCV
jgi:hypothetical protein